MENCLDKSGVAYLWSKIKSLVSGKQDTINDLSTIRSNASLGASAIQSSEKGTTNGICPLDSSGKVSSTYLPSYVDDVIEAYPRDGQTELSTTWLSVDSGGTSIITPETGKIYVLMAASTNYNIYSQFRYSGTAYVKLNDGGISPITNSELDQICV